MRTTAAPSLLRSPCVGYPLSNFKPPTDRFGVHIYHLSNRHNKKAKHHGNIMADEQDEKKGP